MVINNGIIIQFGRVHRDSFSIGIIFPISYTAFCSVTLGTRADDSEVTLGMIATLHKTKATAWFALSKNGWTQQYIGMTCDWISMGY